MAHSLTIKGRLLALLAGAVIFLLLIEGFLRLTGLQPDFFYQLDPELSATYIPGKKGWHLFMNGSRQQWIEINSYGYRDQEWTVSKAPGTLRVALLGDSYLAGMEVSLQKRLSALLEVQLNRKCRAHRHYEVLNFGVTGYGTAQELQTVRHRALQFDPDIVVLFFYTGNDLFNNSRDLDPENRLHYGLDSSGQLVLLPFTVADNSMKRWLRHHSKAYLFIRDRIKMFHALHKALTIAGLMQENTLPGHLSTGNGLQVLQNSHWFRDPPEEIERAWQLTEAMMSELRRLTTEHDARFFIVVIPTKWESLGVVPPGTSNASQLNMNQSLDKMSEICQRLDTECLQLVDAFRKPGVSIEDSFFAEGHWTEAGHAVAARAIFEWIREPLCHQTALRQSSVTPPSVGALRWERLAFQYPQIPGHFAARFGAP